MHPAYKANGVSNQGVVYGLMNIGHICVMALYPSIITVQCLSWDHQRIDHITGMTLHPWTLQAGCTVHKRDIPSWILHTTCVKQHATIPNVWSGRAALIDAHWRMNESEMACEYACKAAEDFDSYADLELHISPLVYKFGKSALRFRDFCVYN